MDVIGGHAVEDTALGKIEQGYVEVMPMFEWNLAEDRIAVVAMLVNCVLAVSMMSPDRIGEKFKLITLGPVGDFAGKMLMFTHNLLQKHHACLAVSKTIAYVFKGKPPLGGAESLMDVQGKYVKILKGHAVDRVRWRVR